MTSGLPLKDTLPDLGDETVADRKLVPGRALELRSKFVQRRDITDEEKETSTSAPSIIKFDTDGNGMARGVIRPRCPTSIHGCFVDRLGNVFVAGNADAMVQKYSPVGTLLLRIGTRGKFDSVDGTRRGKGNNTACDQLHTPSDVIILSRPVMDELQKQDKVAAGPITNVVGTAVSVAARAGAPKPDVSSVDAFKRTLLATKSIVYADPAKDGASGVYFASVLDRLGIAEQMKPKTILVPGAQAADVVAKGEAELGVAQAFEIVPVTGRAIGGPAPRRVRTCDGLLRGG